MASATAVVNCGMYLCCSKSGKEFILRDASSQHLKASCMHVMLLHVFISNARYKAAGHFG
jgi:hypothetical protein